MSDQYISIDNLKFLLYEVHKAQELQKYEYYKDYDKESIDMMMDAASKIADQILFPVFTEMDRKGCHLVDGEVIIHEQIPKMMRVLGEGGWIAGSIPYEEGGMQLPSMVSSIAGLIFMAANNSAIGYAMLTHGAARLIVSFGSSQLKAQFVPSMLEGKWQGTMALTEPQAGSSLSDIITSATPSEDGSYRIEGQKIFISGGDYKEAENVVHLMLARIKGAPAGTKGISLFVVPKYRKVNEEWVSNDVTTAGLFHKMGQKGYVTTHLIMGEKGDCHGYLLGEENKGLTYMFQMMNSARIEVGLDGAGTASAAYYASLNYAKERPQGRVAGKRNLSDPQTLIINHADVRRMLFKQKAIVEGSMSLLLECSRYEDLKLVLEGEESDNYELLLEILTPIAKIYPTEGGQVAISNGLQILGGYGYCEDFPLEQLHRDIRITTIYEGTTGIQSIDLLGRKVLMQNGKALMLLAKEISDTIQKSISYEPLAASAKALGIAVEDLSQITSQLAVIAAEGNIKEYLADANIYSEVFCNVIIGWQWLKQGLIAIEKMEEGSIAGLTPTFYESKLKTMEYFFAYELIQNPSMIQLLKNAPGTTLMQDGAESLI